MVGIAVALTCGVEDGVRWTQAWAVVLVASKELSALGESGAITKRPGVFIHSCYFPDTVPDD